MNVMPLFHGNGRNKLTVGKMYQDQKKEKKLLVVAILQAGQVAMLVIQSDAFFPFVFMSLYMLEKPRLILFILQLTRKFFSSFFLPDHQEGVNLSTRHTSSKICHQ
jgi:hypothetical protein